MTLADTAGPAVDVTVCVPLSLDPTAVIDRVAADVGHPVRVHYRPELMPVQRFVADHRGDPDFRRDAAQEQQWLDMLAGSQVALGFPGDVPDGLRQLATVASGLRWVHGTPAGAGEQVSRAGLDRATLDRVVVTSSAGVHAVPLAEFAMFGLLAMAKDIDRLSAANRERQWVPRWPMRPLLGSHVVVLGFGGIGVEVTRLAAAFGMRVTALKRTPPEHPPPGVERVGSLDDLDRVLPEADAVVVTLPGTPETVKLLDARRLALLPPRAVVVNVGRGVVIDSAALAAALDAGRLRGAVLDVTDEEPLPADSPLWGRPNVIISPHTAALAVNEDDRILEVFAHNLAAYLRGEPLRNVVDPAAGY